MQLNHVLRTRDLISKNDAKVADAQGQGGILNGDGFLDHGFTRPKVFIVLALGVILHIRKVMHKIFFHASVYLFWLSELAVYLFRSY